MYHFSNLILEKCIGRKKICCLHVSCQQVEKGILSLRENGRQRLKKALLVLNWRFKNHSRKILRFDLCTNWQSHKICMTGKGLFDWSYHGIEFVHNLLALGQLGLALSVHLRVFIEIGVSYRETIKRNEERQGPSLIARFYRGGRLIEVSFERNNCNRELIKPTYPLLHWRFHFYLYLGQI